MRPINPTASHDQLRVGARLRASRKARALTIAPLAWIGSEQRPPTVCAGRAGWHEKISRNNIGIFTCAIVTAAAVALVSSLAGCLSLTGQPVAAATLPATGTPARLVRSVSSPGHVADDMRLAAGQCHAVTVNATDGNFLPDPNCTPGGVDATVTQTDISSTICASGYTRGIRPPLSETGKAKHLSLAEYNLGYSKTTEYDHLIPLELGGANSTSNLWPEPNSTGATSFNNPKDFVENLLKAAVCSRTVTLVAAQNAIATNWFTAEHVLDLG